MPAQTNKTPAFLSSLLFIFFFSGFVSLIYQVVWQRLLTLYYGVGTVSITLIVSVYMVGLGLGSLWGGFLAERVKNKILFYFIIELLIGFFGLLSLSILDLLGTKTAGYPYGLALLCMFAFLCVPTVLMGITLPLLTKIFNSVRRDFLKTISFLYFVNTLGAAAGALIASYGIISFFGLDAAIYVAVVINFILAFAILRINVQTQDNPLIHIPPKMEIDVSSGLGILAYGLVFVTGFLAIGYEIIWFRIIEVLVKSSPYMFSSVLFVYLLGIALGSYGMQRYLDQHPATDKRNLFFLLQFSIGICVLAIIVGYYYLTQYTSLATLTRDSFKTDIHPDLVLFLNPLLPGNTLSLGQSFGAFLQRIFIFLDVFLWPLYFMLIPTVLMGASFPLIATLSLQDPLREGQAVGYIYFFNILGNVIGGIMTGFILLVYGGTEKTLFLFIMLGISFLLFAKKCGQRTLSVPIRITVITLILLFSIFGLPKKMKLYELIHISPQSPVVLFSEEGREGVVVTYEKNGKLANYINGLFHGGRPGYHFYHKAIEAISYSKKVNRVLIIGFGTGALAELILKCDEVKEITIVELNNTLIKNLRKFSFARDILSHPRLHLMMEDGRRFLISSDQKYDLILMDPLRAETAYSNNLYSKEFFELVRSRLSEHGILMVWIPEFTVIPNTLLSVFEYHRVYESFFLSSNRPMNEDSRRKENLFTKLTQTERDAVNLISQLNVDQADDNAGKFVGVFRGQYRFPVNKDIKPISEYYLGLHLKSLFEAKPLK